MEYCGQILGWLYYSFIVWLLEYLSLWHYDNIWKGQFFFLTLSIQYCGNCILTFERILILLMTANSLESLRVAVPDPQVILA